MAYFEFPHTRTYDSDLGWLIHKMAELFEKVKTDEEEINKAVKEWLDEHPEATTTVEDGSLTVAKFSDGLKILTVNDYITPQLYGAKADGETDDTAAIQQAIDENPGSTIYFPDGKYKISAPIKTWPDNDRYVNLVFSNSAEVFTEDELECLFYIGGYDLESNYGTTATLGYKKFFIGGKFDGTNCDWVIKMSSATCDQEFFNCLFYHCKNGIQMGHVGTVRSIDSVIAYCNFIGTDAADSYGIRYLKSDNKIQHCRIYGFKTCIKSDGSGLYALDLHTLDLSETPAGYSGDDSCVIDLTNSGGRNTLIGVYGNGEGTFLRLNGNNVNLVKVTDCEYRNWTTTFTNFCFIDILNDAGKTHLLLNGNTVIADPPGENNKTRYGIKGATVSRDISIVDNILWGSEHLTDRGDIICQSIYNSYPVSRTEVMTINHWYYIGSMKMPTNRNKTFRIEFTIGLNRFGFDVFGNSNRLISVGKYTLSPYMANPGVYHLGYKMTGDTISFYLYSETAAPAFDYITGLVFEPDKMYYLGNIYKNRATDSGYTQKALGGPVGDFEVDLSYTFNLQTNSNDHYL